MFPLRAKHFLTLLRSPLSVLAAAGIIVITTVRTAYALLAAGNILWVFLAQTLILNLANPLLPKKSGQNALCRNFIGIFLAAFLSGLYLLLLFFLNPLAAVFCLLPSFLAAVLAVDSDISGRFIKMEPQEAFLRSLSEAIFWGILLIVFALVRECVGHFSISLPGGPYGIREFIFAKNAEPYAIHIMDSAGGALILFACLLALVRVILPPRKDGKK
jgi:hypothetical protein